MCEIYSLRPATAALIVRQRLAGMPRDTANQAASIARAMVQEGVSVYRAVAAAQLHGVRAGMLDATFAFLYPRRPETVSTNSNVRHIQRYRRQFGHGARPDGGPDFPGAA